MPFIDLNKSNSSQNNDASDQADNTQATANVADITNTANDGGSTTVPANVQVDPHTGVRQIDGGDFVASNENQVTAKLEAANQEAAAQRVTIPDISTPAAQPQPADQQPVQSQPQAQVEQPPQVEEVQQQVVQPAAQSIDNSAEEDTLVIGTSGNYAEPQVESQPQVEEVQQQEVQPAQTEPQPQVEPVVQQPEPVQQPELVPQPQPEPVQQPEPQMQPEPTAPQSEPQAEPVAQQVEQQEQTPVEPETMDAAEQPKANSTMDDVMDRSLPELQIKEPPKDPENLELEDQVVELKTQHEKVALESKSYQLDELLTQCIKIGASDLHLTAGYRAMARVDGKLQMIKSQILDGESIKKMIVPLLQRNPAVDPKEDKDIDMSYELAEPKARFRLNVGYQQSTMTATFRLIPDRILTTEELYLPQAIKEYTKFKQGLVLVTGPTGSGKSTTLAALINQINMTEPKHIITIEDPVEFTYPKGAALVDQRAVHIDTTSWPMALRATLRQDPDVVLIGEMRDVETMEAALQVAETGHLVFSTLHTNTAAQTIDRIIDAFPENKQSQVRTQLSGVLMAVISQRLLPIAGGGRRVAVELLVVTSAIRNAIREGKVYQIDNMIQTGAEFGMISMEKSLAQLVREGYISTEMAQRFANKPDDLMSLLGKA